MLKQALAAGASLAVMIGGASHAAPPAAAKRDVAVYQAAVAERGYVLDLLKKVVDIDSGVGDVEGGRQVGAIFAEQLRALGAEVRLEPSQIAGKYPDNVVGVLRGTGRGRLLIIAHLDTVFPKGTVAGRPFSVSGDRAHGPGVGDEKGGAVNALAALKILQARGFRDYAAITVLIDDSEEFGSPGSMDLIKRLSRQADVEFNMEPGDTPDAITVWRKGSSVVRLAVQGRAAHAGMAPQDGRNAIVELIHQLDQLDGVFPTSGDQTTVNVTLIKGGDRENIIPAEAAAGVNLRYRTEADLEPILAKMRQDALHTKVPDTTVTVTKMSGFPPLVENGQIDGLAARAQRIYAELGKSITLSGNGGASESATAMVEGTPAIDGLGYVGGDFHTDHEWIDLNSITPRLYLLTRLLMDCGAHPPSRTPAP